MRRLLVRAIDWLINKLWLLRAVSEPKATHRLIMRFHTAMRLLASKESG